MLKVSLCRLLKMQFIGKQKLAVCLVWQTESLTHHHTGQCLPPLYNTLLQRGKDVSQCMKAITIMPTSMHVCIYMRPDLRPRRLLRWFPRSSTSHRPPSHDRASTRRSGRFLCSLQTESTCLTVYICITKLG